jgi:hypothetical protein
MQQRYGYEQGHRQMWPDYRVLRLSPRQISFSNRTASCRDPFLVATSEFDLVATSRRKAVPQLRRLVAGFPPRRPGSVFSKRRDTKRTVALVREQTTSIPAEEPMIVGEVSANFPANRGGSRGQRGASLRP